MASLSPGTRIGPYQVDGPIGAGGMGEVYRARDTALGRAVALKVLPQAFANDPARLARLKREAHALAAVNHSNVAAIYGLIDSDAGPALVLELVDGLTLADRLAIGPLSIAETLRFSRQIADALEAAHRHGVVHRDLKPANISIRSDGTIKVLDFGIAKFVAGDPSGDDVTLTLDRTAPGLVIGTAPYMSPEQASGTDITPQSDIWSFGAILFEMLSGGRAFSGATTSDVLAAILLKAPDWAAVPPATPPSIVRLVRRCLERDPRERLHDIGDARLELEDAERALRDASPQVDRRTASPSPWPHRTIAWIAGAAIVTLAAALAIFTRAPATSVPATEVRLQLAPPAGTRFVSVPAVSPNGREIVFAAVAENGGEQRLWRRPLNATTATELPGTTGATFPFWSADDRVVGFFAGGKLKRVSVVQGGNPVEICDAPAGRGGLWLEDDTIVFAPAAFSPLMRVAAAGGTPEPYTQLAADETGHRFPQRLPGRQLLYFSVNRTPVQSGTRLVSIDDPHRAVEFVPTRSAAEYVNGFLVFVPPGVSTESPLLAQRLALPDGRRSGEPLQIGKTRISETSGRHMMATSPSGVVAWLGPAEGIGQFTWVARDGRVLETVGSPDMQFGVELSPDRNTMATFRASEIWTMSLARPVPIRVTQGNLNRHPIWSPDGATILSLFQGRGIGTFDLVTTRIATGEVATVLQGSNAVRPMGWTREGRFVWIESPPPGGATIWTLAQGGQPVGAIQDRAVIFEARVSPDGRWIALSSNRSGRPQIEVTSLAAGGPRYAVSVDGGGYPRWRGDGRELYFLSESSRLMAASFSPGAPPLIGTPTPLFEVRLISHPDRGGLFATFEYDNDADGSRFLVNRMISPPDTSMTIIVDWNPSLR